ncbi:MAG: tRNA glutamyl-Q(34) synthetase GluQRS [Thiobacillaceae bacterium]
MKTSRLCDNPAVNIAPESDHTASNYVGRFAPSPTGPLHFGSLVAALGSWLDARAAGGRWLVRMEDLDRPRCVPKTADTILRQLENYGLVWDGSVLAQSVRDEAYEAALQKLRALNVAYPCTCTRSQLAGAPRNAGGETIYPGTCRKRAVDCRQAHAWRVAVPDTPVTFTDRVRGELTQSVLAEVGDFIVKRSDRLFAYQLAVVVDDAYQHITHVVRGADLLWNTPRQIVLQNLLGLPNPRYAHLPLITNAAGQKLSKQTLATALPGHGRGRVLAQALTALGQALPDDLANADPAAILAWASTHWQIANVPLKSMVANPAHAPENSPTSPDR